MSLPDLQQRTTLYLEPLGAAIEKLLGCGTDGEVWQTTRLTAAKAFLKAKHFELELECYLRLQAATIESICGFSVPQLVDYDRELAVLEMSIVKPPYLLDFGKVYLDRPPDFSAEVLGDWRQQQRELLRRSQAGKHHAGKLGPGVVAARIGSVRTTK